MSIKYRNSATILILSFLFPSLSSASESINSKLIPNLINVNTGEIKKILHECKCTEKIDHSLVDWINAVMAYEVSRYSESIRLYRKVISAHPDWYSARLQLSMVLYMNKDILSAEKQLRKLRNEDISSDAVYLIDRYIEKIKKTDVWSFQGGITFLNEKNINNAPDSSHTLGRWKPEKAQSGKGIMYWGEAEKTNSLPENLFTIVRFTISGKSYWDNHAYDELSGTFATGFGFRNVNTHISMLPFFEKNLYKRKKGNSLVTYSETSGLKIESRFQLSTNLLLHTDFNVGENKYKNHYYLNGYRYSLGEKFVFFPNSRQYIFSGIIHDIVTANEKDNAFNETLIQAGWMYEWSGGISTIFSSGYGYKRNNAPDFWGIKKIAHEYGTSVTIWNRDLYIMGVTPKITWTYRRTDSNHPFYDTERHRIFWSFSKFF
ncbi:DUF560 domain-containing protein [Salmonella enterica subsp. enterica serovar Kiambu]|nr:DUF560 domain-containing protein [Salmonella enterica subsp. enterica serovar Kiambu]